MRTKKALMNTIANIMAFVILFIPNLLVRKVFNQYLGNEILGLNSLYSNIIGWLSIMEMGIGTSIIFSLYKPFADNDRDKVNAYINYYGKVYHAIGFIILIIGIVISPFLTDLIRDDISIWYVVSGFILFLLNTFLSYMFTHKICIIYVAQDGYIVTFAMLITKCFIAIFQVIVLIKYSNFLLYLTVQLVINLIYFIAINKYISIKYDWLNDKSKVIESQEKKELFIKIKAMFLHKIGFLFVQNTDNIVISKFIGLSVLGNVANYYMIISSIQNFISGIFTGLTSSIGNLLASESIDKSYEIHKKIFFLNFWLSSLIVISLFNTIDQFISLWFGTKFTIDRLSLIFILINVYFALMRSSIDRFQEGSGEFHHDRFAPLIEGGVNFISSIILIKKIGLPGVFLGTVISNFFVIFWTKPYVVYKYVFRKNVVDYFVTYFKYLMILIIPLSITHILTLSYKSNISINAFIINCAINIFVINSIYFIIFYNSEDLKYFRNIFTKFLFKTEINEL